MSFHLSVTGDSVLATFGSRWAAGASYLLYMWVLIWVLMLAWTLLLGVFDEASSCDTAEQTRKEVYLRKKTEQKTWFKMPFKKKPIEVDTKQSEVAARKAASLQAASLQGSQLATSGSLQAFCKLAAPMGQVALMSAIAFCILHTLFIWNQPAWLKVLFVVCCLRVASGSKGKAPVKGAGKDDIEAGPAGPAATPIRWFERPFML